MTRPPDPASEVPDEPDALLRAERLFDAASQSGLDLGHLDDTALALGRLAWQRAPYLATLLTPDPDRLFRIAADRIGGGRSPYDRLAAELVSGPDVKATIGDLAHLAIAIATFQLAAIGTGTLDLEHELVR